MVGKSEIELVSDSDVRFCFETLQKVSRTFALSIGMMPSPLRESVGVAYLLCRIVDTIEDDPSLEHSRRNYLFDVFNSLLRDDSSDPDCLARYGQGVGETPDEEQMIAGSAAAFRTWRKLDATQRGACMPWILEMSDGMRAYSNRSGVNGGMAIVDVPDLEAYCGYVAGTVGALLTDLFRLEVPGAKVPPPSRMDDGWRFGLGLQMVNILRDVAEDSSRGICWLPLSVLNAHNLTVGNLLDPAMRLHSERVVKSIASVARSHLRAANRYTLSWPSEGSAVRLFCSVPLALAWLTLDEIELSSAHLELGSVPKVTREVVYAVTEKAVSLAADDLGLAAWLSALESAEWTM